MRAPLAGIGQIYFQASPLFGAVLLGCLYLTAPVLAAGCLLGVGAASGTAWRLDFPQAGREAGVYGFNGALAGVGLCAGWQWNVALLCWIIVAGSATAVLFHAMTRWGMTPLTLLFVLVMWLARAAGPALGLLPKAAAPAAGCGMAPLAFVFCAIGQASFVGMAGLGLVLWAALARGGWRPGVSSLVGAASAWCVVSLAALVAPALPLGAVATGAGVNSALTVLGLSVHDRHWRWRCAGGIACLALCAACARLRLDFYTLPFVLSVWLVLALTRPE